MGASQSESFQSFGQVRTLLDDLFRVRPAIYWIDFSVTMAIAWAAFRLAVQTPWSAFFSKGLWLLISAFAFFRGLIFVHELEHVGRSTLTWFRYAWNACCGLFFFVPGYTYAAHAFHHRASTFSTNQDPEYVPVASQRAVEIAVPFLIFPLVPLVLVVRFLILGPISLIAGGCFRDWLLRHASTLKMNPRFEWTSISPDTRRRAMLGDLACAGWWILFLAVSRWLWHREPIAEWYLVTYLIFSINHVRSLARHRYVNATGATVDYQSQILDSVTISGFSPLTWIFMPVGLRYHSVHHMFPSLPYHALGEAHRRLAAALPPEHVYRKTLEPHFCGALVNVLRASQKLPVSATSVRLTPEPG